MQTFPRWFARPSPRGTTTLGDATTLSDTTTKAISLDEQYAPTSAAVGVLF